MRKKKDPRQPAITQLYHTAGLTPPEGRGMHTMAFHRMVVALMKEDEVKSPHAVAMKKLGRDKAVMKSHRKENYRRRKK